MAETQKIIISREEADSDEWNREEGAVWKYKGDKHPKGYYDINRDAEGFSARHLGSDLGKALKKIGLRPASSTR